jgi:hypothetical protein
MRPEIPVMSMLGMRKYLGVSVILISVFPDHVFELELSGMGGSFLGAWAFERCNFLSDGDRDGPALSFFEKGDGSKSTAFEILPLFGGYRRF